MVESEEQENPHIQASLGHMTKSELKVWSSLFFLLEAAEEEINIFLNDKCPQAEPQPDVF